MPDSVNPSSVLDEVRASLEGLKRTPDGAMLFRMIERGLARHDKSGGRMEEAYVRFLYTLLDRFASDSTGNPVTRVKARLIQQRLTPYVDLEKIRSQYKKVSPPAPPPVAPKPTNEPRIQARADTAPATIPEPVVKPEGPARKTVSTDLFRGKIGKLEPLSDELTVTHEPVPVEPVQMKPEKRPEPAESQPIIDGYDAIEVPGDIELVEESTISPQGQSLVTNDNAPEQTRDSDLEESLEVKINDTAAKNKIFNSLLKSNLKALEMAENAEDMMDLKQLLIRGLQELAQGQDALDIGLMQTNHFISEIKQDRQKLKSRVEKLAKHGVTDELTGLPKRKMLSRQLKAEVGRARRYGSALALSILDIDNLSHINQQYGRAAGDEVLACYVREVLANFRAYDFVARYGGDEFAIIFPNTPKDGAYRALEKARKIAADTVISHNGQSISLPGFSSVLTLYSQGEEPEVLLQRADEALSMAKLRGSGQILISLPTPQ